jgi:hypothetical protein
MSGNFDAASAKVPDRHCRAPELCVIALQNNYVDWACRHPPQDGGPGDRTMPDRRELKTRLRPQGRSGALSLGVALCVLGFSPPAVAHGAYTTFDPKGSGGTQPLSVNDDGVVAGIYHSAGDPDGYLGFVRAANGKIATINAGKKKKADSPSGVPPHSTFANSINSADVIVGYYEKPSIHGLLRAADGTITTIDPPKSQGTYLTGINDSGVIAGNYNRNGIDHGFVLADGAFTLFDPTGSVNTWAAGVNSAGIVAGYYVDGSDVYHGFARVAGGTITTFDPAGSISTYALAINTQGSCTGYFTDASYINHGFVRAADGTITSFDPSGSISTYAQGINSNGAITGYYEDSGNAYHGFVRTAGGTITTFDVPGGVDGTFPFAINSSGLVTGEYQDANDVQHGFLGTP